ncbi:Holliday junction resolvase MOC1, chloroplastic [Rosa sericea]
MEHHLQLVRTHNQLMNLRRNNPLLYSVCSQLRPLCTVELSPTKPIKSSRISVGRVRDKVSDAQLKDNWLASLSCPFPQISDGEQDSTPTNNSDSSWVFGIDPDVSGALALLKGNHSASSAQVYDSPHLKVLVGKSVRRRLDAKSIVQLLSSFDAPLGSTAYLEQSTPYPQDGKQGWWSGGFGYGLWIGILVGLGFSVVPVPSLLWKKNFELTGSMSTKDDSRRVASALFPSLSSELRRKKDHGRAEALLIAAYGKGLKLKSESCNPEVLMP